MQCAGLTTSKPAGFAALPKRTSTRQVSAASSGGKTDLKKQGLNKIKNNVIKNNLMGRSDAMKKKDWVDASGRKRKYGAVYKFEDKYGANVDGYSPIFTPDSWSESGESYSLGTKGLLAWAGLVVVLLGVGVNLIVSTSNL